MFAAGLYNAKILHFYIRFYTFYFYKQDFSRRYILQYYYYNLYYYYYYYNIFLIHNYNSVLKRINPIQILSLYHTFYKTYTEFFQLREPFI